MSHAVSAPGKAFLFGEYAVLEGHEAYATALEARATAHPPRSALGEVADTQSPFVQQALCQVKQHLQRTSDPKLSNPSSLDALSNLVVSTVGFSAGNRKFGLGSSAAVCAAVVGFGLQQVGYNLAQSDTRMLALGLATKAHRAAQGNQGSGADVAASTLGGLIGGIVGDFHPVTRPSSLHMAFFDMGQAASTVDFVERVHRAKLQQTGAYQSAIETIASATQIFANYVNAAPTSVSASSFDTLIEAADRHNDGLRQLSSLAKVPILNPKIEAMLEAAREFGLPAKPSGAGGGDLFLVLADQAELLDRFARHVWQRLQIAQLHYLKFAEQGIRSEPRVPVHSRLQGFFKLSVNDRRKKVAEQLQFETKEFGAASQGLSLDLAENMVENVIGTFELPLAVATNFSINGRDYLVPMCIEEASVVAAASNAARMVREGGGFVAHSDPPWMIAQIQLIGQGDSSAIHASIMGAREELLRLADTSHPRLVQRGGGARDLECRVLDSNNLIVHVLVDCRDAMGANLLNTVAETVAPFLEKLSGRQARLRILSNLSDCRASHVSARVPPQTLQSGPWSGEQVIDFISDASRFAELDPYRATTHNKGIMNGVDAVVMATGNDWRAMEASAHAYAARSGRYSPLAIWKKDAKGWLQGTISLPTALGVVGGATRMHPTARLALQVLDHPSARELGQIVASVGLASNLAALKALATEGIQRGHMSLHARSVAVGAGAMGPEIEQIANEMIKVGEIKHDRACSLLKAQRTL